MSDDDDDESHDIVIRDGWYPSNELISDISASLHGWLLLKAVERN